MRATCLYVATKLGDVMDELVVIGGLVPSLLIEQRDLPARADPHTGTNLSCVNAWPEGALPMGEEWIVTESSDDQVERTLNKIIHTLRRKDARNHGPD